MSRARNEKGAPCLTATEIGLARDAGARRRAAAAMRAVVTTRDHAKQTVALAETFWAWMRSVLELDEKEKKARRISGEGFPKNVTTDERAAARRKVRERRLVRLFRIARGDVRTILRLWYLVTDESPS